MEWAIAAVVLVIVGGLLAVTYYFSNKVLYIPTYSHETIMAYEVDGGRVAKEDFERLPKEEVRIDSPHGYPLYAWFIPSETGETDRTVVFAHGVTSSLVGMVKYTGMFRRRGFNVLLYDHRRHGLSGGAHTTYGFYEKHDLKTAVDWVYRRLGPDTTVGVFGESMGAATALQYAAIDDRPKFVIADCPYSDLEEQLAYRLKIEFKLPKYPLLPITSLWCKLRAGFFFREVSPIRDLPAVKAPILLAHGEKDTYVPNMMSLAMFDIESANVKELYLAPGADHAQSWVTNRDEYERKVDEFLRAHRLIPEPEPAGV